MCARALQWTLTLAVAITGAPSQAQPAPAPLAAVSAIDVYLTVSFNGQRSPYIARFQDQNGRLSARGIDLRGIGIDTPALGIPDQEHVPLDQIPGLTYRFDAAAQEVDIDMPDRYRVARRIDGRGLAPTAAATTGRGFLINYDLYARTERNNPLALWSEQRYFDQYGVLSNTGTGYLQRDLSRYVRYDTSWTHSDPETLTTRQLGDTISGSLAWSRSIRMAGFQWRRNFSLRPDLVTFPMPAFGGSAVVPSSVDVYINNIRRYSGDVPSGPFVVDNVAGITGFGQANVITRDALGRPVSQSLPIYIDTRLLAEGMSSYSVEAGFLRRAYGWRSFDYKDDPALSASWQYGLSNAVTAEAHGEATTGLYNVGTGVLAKLGMAGVVNASVAGSAGRSAGLQVGLGYQYVDPRFSIDLQTLRSTSAYADLAANDGIPVARASDRATLALPLGGGQSVSFSYIGQQYPGVEAAHIGSMAYSTRLGNRATLTMSAFQDFSDGNSRGAFLSLGIALDDVSVNATTGWQDGEPYANASAIRTPDYGGGFGWGVQAGTYASGHYEQGWGRYLGRYGEVTVGAQRFDGRTTGELDVNGALVVMDGTAQASRRIDDSFALVSTGDEADVPVLHQNRVTGHTGDSGYLVVPDLNSYQTNTLDIDGLDLPPNAHVTAYSRDIVPQWQSGVLVKFGIEREAAATVLLVDGEGKPLPVGARVVHRESGSQGVVGYGSQTFVRDLVDVNHLDVRAQNLACTARFAFEAPDDGALPRLGPVACVGR